MLLLLFAVTVTVFALTVALSRGSATNYYGAGFWFLMLYVGFVMYGYVTAFVDAGLPESGPQCQGLLVVAAGLLSVTCGFMALDRPARTRSPESRVLARTTDRDLMIMGLVILVPSWLYFVFLGSVPLFSGVSAIGELGAEGIGALQSARLERDPYVNAGAAAIPLQGLLEVFRNVGTPALFAATILRWRSLGFRAVYPALTISCLVTVIAAGQKWPLQYLLLAALISLALDAGRLPGKTIFVLASLGLVLGALLNILQGRTGDQRGGSLPDQLLAGVEAVLDRTFLGYVDASIRSYGLHDSRLQDLDGASYWQSLKAYLPGLGQSFSVDFYRIVYGDDSGFTAPPDFSTELYINWGLIGVVIGALLWGLLLGLVDNWLRRQTYSPETAGLASIAILSLATVTTSGLMTSLRVVVIALPVLAAIRAFGGLPVGLDMKVRKR